MRKDTWTKFPEILKEALESDGKVALPNVTEIEDPQEALNFLSKSRPVRDNKPYRFLVRTFEPVPPSLQTREVAYYPTIFTCHRGMGGRFDGSGAILCTSGGRAKVFSFSMCDHEWDESGANHMRGWHPAICRKCGFDASIDSGD